MCEFGDKIENKGREEWALGAKKEIVLNLHGIGVTEDVIAKMANVSVSLVREWLSQPPS